MKCSDRVEEASFEAVLQPENGITPHKEKNEGIITHFVRGEFKLYAEWEKQCCWKLFYGD